MKPADAAQLLDGFGRSAARFMQASNRDKFTAPLFNVPGRFVVGGHCFAEHVPEVIDIIESQCSAEEIGTRMGALGSRPNYVNLSALLFGYLNGREQLGLLAGAHPDAGADGGSAERTVRVLSFWSTVLQRYLDDAALLPEDRGWRLPVLRANDVSWLADSLGSALGPGARKLMAVAELYTFALNGEARVGVLHHGPYDLGDGSTMIVKELVGLRENEIGWSALDTTSDEDHRVDALVRVQHVRDVDLRVDLFGSLHSDPAPFGERVLGEALFAVVDGAPTELTDEQIVQLTEHLNRSMLAIYRETLTWSSTEQVAYGWRLYAGLLIAFGNVAGVDIRDEVVQRFRATAERVTPGIESGDERLLILERLGSEAQPYSAWRTS